MNRDLGVCVSALRALSASVWAQEKVPLASGDDRAGYAYFSFFLVCYRPLDS